MRATKSIRCREFVNQSTDLLEGALGAKARLALESHANDCPACRRYLSQIESTVDRTRELGRQGEPSRGRVEELMMAVSGDPIHEGVSPVVPSQYGFLTPPNVCSNFDEDVARAFLEDRLPDEQQLFVLEHLIDGCEMCAALSRRVAFPELGDVAHTRRDLREESLVPSVGARYQKLLEDLLSDNPSEIASLTPCAEVNTERFVLWVIRQGRNCLSYDPTRCERMAEITTEASRHLSGLCRARAAMFRGHVIRKTRVDFVEADRWFDEAEAGLEGANGCRITFAKLLRMRALARQGQSRYREALELFCRAEDIYRELGEISRIGECALDRAATETELLGPEVGIETLLRAAALMRWDDSVRYSVAATQNLTIYYADVGRVDRAMLALAVCRRKLPQLGARDVESLYLDWAEGKILNAAGDFGVAAELLQGIRDRFLDLGLPSQAAFVSLDLAVSLLELRRSKEIAEIAEPMIAYFLSRGLTGEAMVAVRLFRESVVAQSLSIAQIRSLELRLSRLPRL